MLHNSKEQGKGSKARFHTAKTSLHLLREVTGCLARLQSHIFNRKLPGKYQAITRIFKDWPDKLTFPFVLF